MNLRLNPQTGVQLAGTGAALPSDVGLGTLLSNADVYHRLLGDDAEEVLAARGWRLEHPSETWGVERREWIRRETSDLASDTAGVVELASKATQRALDDARVVATDVHLLLAATSSPPRITSTLAASIGHRLGVSAPCFDVRASGAGGLAAWLTAVQFVGGNCRVAVVVAVETPSLYLDEKDLATALVYGDGAAAVVLRYEPETGGGLLGAILGRADAPGRSFTVPGSLPPTSAQIDGGKYRFQRPDAEYRDALGKSWAALCEELRCSFPEAANATDYFLPYAVTAAQVRDATAAFGLPSRQTVHTLADHGCLGCPGPLVSLDLLRRDRRVHAGQVLALAAVAGGVSIAGMFWRL